MKKTILFFSSILFFCLLSTAQPYGNEWIDYDKTYYKIKIVEEGLYRISTIALQSAGIPLTGDNFKMFHQGEEIPIFTTTGGTFGSTDYIEFYGKQLDGKLDNELFHSSSHQLHDYHSLFTDTAAYFLTIDDVNPNLRMDDTNNNFSNPGPPQEYFLFDAIAYVNSPDNAFPSSQHSNGIGERFSGVNVYYADYNEGEGFVGLKVEKPPLNPYGNIANYHLPTPGLHSSGPDPEVYVKYIGLSDDFFDYLDHRFIIKIEDQLWINDEYEGYDVREANFNIPLNSMSTPTTHFEFSANGTSSVDRTAVSHIELTYPRNFDFSGLTAERFALEATSGSNNYLEIENFDGGGIQPVLYDMTNRMRMIGAATGNQTLYNLPAPTSTEDREIYLTSVFEINTVSAFEELTFVDYSNPANQGDYLLVSHPRLKQGGVDYVAEYETFRSSAIGGGYEVVNVDVNQLYDQFAYGVKTHPLAIRHFVDFGLNTWTVEPEYLFLVGRSYVYHKARNNPGLFTDILVPTYGATSSDNMLTALDTLYSPRLAVGRITAEESDHVRIYLDKAVEHANRIELDCTKEDKDWMKQVFHIGGGNNQSQREEFNGYLENYETIIEDTLYGANVYHYSSLSTDPITQAPTEIVDSLFDYGLNMITFWGHAASFVWQVDIGPASNYDNEGKYPFILANSCFVGQVHDNTSQVPMAIDYVLEDDAGAIGYLATVQFGFPTALNTFSEEFYENIAHKNYNKPVGKSILDTHSWIQNTYGFTPAVKVSSQEFTLQGDPAVNIFPFNKADYIIETPDLYTEPTQITAQIDSFTLNVIVTNLGMAAADSFTVNVNRIFPDATQLNVANKRFAYVPYKDTLSMNIYTDPVNGFGSNQLVVSIDSDNQIPEECEDNNEATMGVIVSSDNVIPVYPCEYAIVGDDNFTFTTSTATAVLDEKTIIFNLDTSANFNSPLLVQFTTQNEGGVVEWENPATLIPNTVYYWRVTNEDSFDGVSFDWKASSFIYLPGESNGWNMSHFYQWQNIRSDQVFVNSLTRDFEYADNVKNIYWSTVPGLNNYDEVFFKINNVTLKTWSCVGEGSCSNLSGGIQIVVLNPSTFEPMLSEFDDIIGNMPNGDFDPANNNVGASKNIDCDAYNPNYGNVHCGSGDDVAFDFPTNWGANNAIAGQYLQNITNFLQDVPNGHYVLIKSILNHNLDQTQAIPGITGFLNDLYAEFDALNLSQLTTLENGLPMLAITKKADPEFTPIVEIGTSLSSLIEIDQNITGKWFEGDFYSPSLSIGGVGTASIGPASNWSSLQYEYDGPGDFSPDDDEITLNVYGIRANGIEDFLFTTGTDLTYDLSSINADFYPYLRLEALTRDLVNNTPPQMDYWRVYFDGVVELALDADAHFVFESDSLNIGQDLLVEVSVANIHPALSSDSILINYEITNNDNVTYLVDQLTVAPLAAGESQIVSNTIPSANLQGNNILIVNVNPGRAQPEKALFNNLMILEFYVRGDNVNPLLDVTFDGEHILNGDIVSAHPEINIKLYDESPFSAMNDTIVADMHLTHPDGTVEQIYFADPDVEFIPADPANLEVENVAQILIHRMLPVDGIYELVVNGRDMALNASGDYSYRKSFEVINKAMISHMVNYPNPFSSSTQFVFTLTGSSVPEFFKIQILTVTGKVVKEIGQDEIGNLHVGKNVSDYRWDGKDRFGSQLANGVYFYRVIAKNSDTQLDIYSSAERTASLDELYGSNDLGKMYLMR